MPTKKPNTTIKIDVSDYYEETLRDESFIETDEDIFEQLDNGRSTSQITRAAIASRTAGVSPQDILRDDKLLHFFGAQAELTGKIARKKHDVQTADGATYQSRDYIGMPGRDGEEDSPKTFVKNGSREGLNRALDYLEHVVPGYIWNRMLIVMENGGDVKFAANNLKHAIDKFVERLA